MHLKLISSLFLPALQASRAAPVISLPGEEVHLHLLLHPHLHLHLHFHLHLHLHLHLPPPVLLRKRKMLPL